MTNEQYKKVNDALVEFVVRVSRGETTSEKEIEILPTIVHELKNLSHINQ